ncbi:MAG: hypothetical protein GY936_12145 [Ignavibacteriae bacterium]|nr:hypothetical protein [Ignavibacteriota bacterium]
MTNQYLYRQKFLQGKMFSDLSPNSKKILFIFIVIVTFTIAEAYYYNYKFESMDEAILQKRKAVSLIQLPDLALVTETVWLRHRTITNMFCVFPEDGTLLDYYPSSFVYNLKLPKKITTKQQSNEF